MIIETAAALNLISKYFPNSLRHDDYFAKRQEIKGKILRIIANRTKKKSIPKVDQA